MRKLQKLLLSLFKVGCIGFGGGNALIPVIEKEVVKEHKIVSQKDYNKFIVAANITPGALPVEMAVALGKTVAGVPGMILSAMAIALPGVFATLLFIIAFSTFSQDAIQQVQYMSVGISIYIIYLLFMYNKKVVDSVPLTDMKLKRMAVILCVCFFTAGKEVYRIFGLIDEHTPIFDVSTVNVLLLAFFVIFSTGKGMTKLRFVLDAVITFCYMLCVGKAQIISNKYVLWVLYALMAVIAVNGIRESFVGEKVKVRHGLKKVIKEELGLLLFLIVASVPAILTCRSALAYLAKGYMSSVISFGGGEAYLTVAESMFLGNEIQDTQLYIQLLPVVNALPGSILTKMLAGVGFYEGYNVTGSILVGILVAFAGFVVALAASGAVLCGVMYIYEIFEKLTIFELLGKCIKPIVGGLLISTGLSLFYEVQKIMAECSIGLPVTIVLVLGMGTVVGWIRKTKKVPEMLIVIACGLLSVILCNVVA